MQDASGAILLSASDLSNFLACRHLTALDFAHLRGLLERPRRLDAVSERLRELGYAHEQRYVETLQRLGGVVDLRGHLDADTRTIEAMREGANAIVQAKFEIDGWLGYADVLRRVERPSRLGPWSYEVYDTKLARETRGGTILQLSAYSELVGLVQGLPPEHFHVITPDPVAPLHTFRVDDFAAYFRLIRRRLLEALERGAHTLLDESYPEPVAHCEICRWWLHCNATRRRDDHLSFIANVTRLQRVELVSRGFDTMAIVGRMPVPIVFQPVRGSLEAIVRVREQARVQIEQRSLGRPVFELLDIEADRGLSRLPAPSHGDIFLDLEGDPFAREGGREYLFGLDGPSPGATGYTSRWAFDDSQERAAFEAVIDVILERWAADPAMHVYHFGHYEPAALKRLMGRYATRADAIDRLLRGERFVDLHAIVRHALRAGVESYSLKKLEPLYGFGREVALDDAAAHLRAVETALEANAAAIIPPSTREAIEGYNRDDCRSARALRDWLEQVRAGQVAAGFEITRPAPPSEAPSERVTQLDADVETLRAQLLEKVPLEASERDQAQQVRWMLAYLIDWHRRESKAEWWEYFRLCELPEEELLDESLAIAGLTFVQNVEIVRHSKTGRPTGSVVDRYRYPAQDVEIRRKGKLKLQDGRALGEVVAIDRDARLIDIRKGPECAELHPSSVFSASIVPTEGPQRSVMRVAAGVVAGESSCAADLLYRRSPRLHSEPFSSRAGEPVVERLVRLITDLHDTTLAIQGPPGAGKTYAGARMICRLIAEGRQVGVTAVSHRVIRNLLDAVRREAAARGLTVATGHKLSEESDGAAAATPDDCGSAVREFVDNSEALEALANGSVNVLGGTAWLWSREEAQRAADVLFVDEAGQMSLASVLAVAPAAASLVLLGDPQQLEQPQKASHPDGIGVSALHYLLDGHQTMPEDRGVFLPATWRLAPAICSFTSEVFYEGRLESRPGLEQQRLTSAGPFDGAGLWWVPVDHHGNQSSSPEEIDAIARIVEQLLRERAQWIDEHGVPHTITAADFRIVAPYNAQVNRLKERFESLGVPVGTVDRFQGQEAPIAIYSITSSSAGDAPRGLSFLYSLNRLNVASSRARCAVILVAAAAIFEPDCRTPEQMRLANALCRYRELARVVDASRV